MNDDRIEAHFLTCFIALMFIRILENRTVNKLTIEKIIDTLRGYNFQHIEGSGYIPTYTRNDATDILHEAFGFRTDYFMRHSGSGPTIRSIVRRI